MKPFEQQNYYELLEVPVSAPAEEIRAAYSRLMELYAPDSIAVYALVDPEQVDTLRARMTEAMEILTHEGRRAEYDKDLGVPAQRMVEAATAAGKPSAEATPEAGSVARAAEALATAAASDTAEAGVEPSPAEPAARPEPVASAPPEEGKGAEPAEAPVVGRDDFRTAFFRGFSFAYVSSSLQDTRVVGSAVFVPPSTVQPEAVAPPPATESPVAPEARGAPEAPAPAAVSSSAGAEVAPSASAPGPSTASQASAPAEAPARTVESLPTEPAVAVTPSSSSSTQAAEPASDVPARVEGTPEAVAIVPTRPPARPVPPPLPSSRAAAARAAAEAQPPLVPEEGRQAQRPSSGRQLSDAQVLSQDSAIATAEAALAQVAARVREPQPQRPRIPDIPADAEFNGELLRRVREARGFSLQQVADRTRISSRHLENVEADRYNALPAPVYLRGILMNLARELGLDPLRVSRSYLALASEKAGVK